MKTAQYRWSQNLGWKPDLPKAGIEGQQIVFAFGARPLIQEGKLVAELRDHFKAAPVIGCSTSGEIVGDEVVDDTLVATAVGFDHIGVRTACASVADAQSSYEVGAELPGS